MIQALHAILETPGDQTKVSLICSNKTQDDILCGDLLDTWASVYPDRLHVEHVISRLRSSKWGLEVASSADMFGSHIRREIIEKHSARPYEDVLVMVCGPDTMY